MDTIFAVSSGRPPAAIAVIRISGPDAFAAARALAGPLPAPRVATLRRLRDATGDLLDQSLVLVFPGPASATGEDVAEFHCHGGRAVISAIERALAALPGLRMAEPGEFTRRALANGVIDLSQAEGLADLLQAETETQRRVALAAAEGAVSKAIHAWLDRLSVLSAETEALLDFSDEGDVAMQARNAPAIGADVKALGGEIKAVAAAPPVERIRDGILVVIAGPPNSGKSTLLNRLAERDAAIVTPISGTTRDVIDVPVSRRGIAYRLTDTAGLTVTDDVVERIGVDRARRAIAEADIVLWLGDNTPPCRAIWIHARADLLDRRAIPPGRAWSIGKDDDRAIAGLWELIDTAAARLLPQSDRPALTNAQRGQALAAAAMLMSASMDDSLLLAESVRVAANILSEILGLHASELMLSALFARFCVGK